MSGFGSEGEGEGEGAGASAAHTQTDRHTIYVGRVGVVVVEGSRDRAGGSEGSSFNGVLLQRALWAGGAGMGDKRGRRGYLASRWQRQT